MVLTITETIRDLKDEQNWVAWKYTEQDGKLKKTPICPRTGKNASPTNPDTWTNLDTAVAFAERNGYFTKNTGGVGFMFGAEPCCYAGIDIDDCISPDGKLSDMAEDIMRIMNTYTERSVSGKGIHLLFHLCNPLSEIGSRKKDDTLNLEIYDSKRYFVMTGNVYGEERPIAERTEELREVYEKYMRKRESDNKVEKPHHTQTVNTNSVKNSRVQGVKSSRSEDLSDSELWERMFSSEHGREIQALYNGDISGYDNDDSRADLAMCSILVWWTHGDAGRVDRMFRQSGLYRDKWERSDYREWTIGRAMNNDTYCPPEATAKVGHVSERTPEQVSTVGGGSDIPSTVADTLDNCSEVWTPPITAYDYVEKGIFASDLEQFQKYPPILSGFSNFDDAQGGFVPGLYIIGAFPSLGKTTFMSQITDNMAMKGNNVLYFSLEQSRLEMVTKSISRLTAQLDKGNKIKNAVSSINIRRGNYVSDIQRELVKKAVEKYQDFSRNITFVECGFDSTVSDIAETVEGYMSHTGLRPCVIIDYLQIVQSGNDKNANREAVECVIRRLKKLQITNNLVMFAISSFNRSNYTTSVDYASFKETGLVEYSADVILGLQPTAMTNALFMKEKKDKEQRDAIDKALSAIPRKVMLKNLKNRYGKRGYSCGFMYDCRFELFEVDNAFKENGHDAPAIL
ncbi:MAG: hypothetical protein IJ587_10305 [Synergistaceae bacterium]|nr:hypothetical protein [Synergistaceae bacterium]